MYRCVVPRCLCPASSMMTLDEMPLRRGFGDKAAPSARRVRIDGDAAGPLVAPPSALYQVSLIMTHRDRAGDPSGHRAGHRAGRREAAGPAGHRQGFPTPADTPTAGSPARPGRRLPRVLWTGAFGRPNACGRAAWLAMPGTCLGEASGGARIAAPRAPGRKPWEAVSMGHYQRSLV